MKGDQEMPVCHFCKQEIKAGQQSAEIYNGNYRVHVWSKDCGLKTTISTETVAVAVDALKIEIRPRTLLNYIDLESMSDVAFCLDAIIAKHGIVPLEEAMKRKYPLKDAEPQQQKTCSFCGDRYDSVHICSKMNPSLYNWWTHELAELQLSAERPNKFDSWGGLWMAIDADVKLYGLAYLRKTETSGLIMVPFGMGEDYRRQLDQKNLIEIKCRPTNSLTDELRDDDVLGKIVKHETPPPEKQGTWRDRPSML